MAVVWETAFVSVKAADVTVKDLPHAREWRRVGHWQNERLEEKRPLFLNLSNYGQAGFQSTFVKSIQGKDDDREILCYAQRNPMWQDMVHRKVRGKRSVALKVIMNDEKTKVALVWSNAVTGDQLHVSVCPSDPPLRAANALAVLGLELVAKGEATQQESFYLITDCRGPLWSLDEPAPKRRRRA